MTDNKKRGFAKLHGIEITNTSTAAVTLTATTVWKENNPQSGLLSKSTFIPFIKFLRVEDYEQTESLFQFLRERRRFASSLKHRTDKGGNGYYWASFSKPMGNDGAKVMANTELLNLVSAYIDGKVFIDFDMDELIDEGLS